MTMTHTWDETRRRLRSDADRLRQLSAPVLSRPGLFLHTSFLCVLMHRLSHHGQRNGWPRLARLWWRLNILLTGADISPSSDLGPGLFIQNPMGVAICGHAGRNLSVMAGSGLSIEPGRREDVGAGPGLPVLGDDVWIEPHGGVLGPVRVGHRVRIGAGISVAQDVSDDCELQSPIPRVVARPSVA